MDALVRDRILKIAGVLSRRNKRRSDYNRSCALSLKPFV